MITEPNMNSTRLIFLNVSEYDQKIPQEQNAKITISCSDFIFDKKNLKMLKKNLLLRWSLQSQSELAYFWKNKFLRPRCASKSHWHWTG